MPKALSEPETPPGNVAGATGKPTESSTVAAKDNPAPGTPPLPAASKGIRHLSPSLHVDLDKSQVILESTVVLREGPLELLVCPYRTKEHESILAAEVEPKAFQLALLMIGAKPGHPARFEPFRPPTGQRIRIRVEYQNAGKTHGVDARQWIRRFDAGGPMQAEFVFAGSGFFRAAGDERPIFMGDEGDLVCVANFTSSIIDVRRRAPNDNAELLYEPWTERIPRKGTKVRIIFEPLPETEPTKKDLSKAG